MQGLGQSPGHASAKGNAAEAERTTQKAADILGASRPYLIKILEKGLISYHRVGSHRRIKIIDLVAYRDGDRAARRRMAEELTAEAEKLGPGC